MIVDCGGQQQQSKFHFRALFASVRNGTFAIELSVFKGFATCFTIVDCFKVVIALLRLTESDQVIMKNHWGIYYSQVEYSLESRLKIVLGTLISL